MRRILLALLLVIPCLARAQSMPAEGAILFSDDFNHGLANWTTELESGGTVSATNGVMTIDVPAGASVWFRTMLKGPVIIEYTATVVSNGGTNDRLSDLNCFWMARDSRSPADIFATKRSGKFADYNQLLTYYVGVGGNTNSTTRFRRYIGDSVNRPLRPQDDLRDAPDLLTANVSQKIVLVADGNLIQYYRDGKKLFEMNDPEAYTSGWFAFRTTHSHLEIKDFKVYGLKSASPPAQ